MTLPVPNLRQKFVDGAGYILSPWNNWLQSFSQPPQTNQTVIVSASPFDYTPNNVGTVYIIGGTVSDVSFIRGTDIISLGNVPSVLLSIGDTVRVTYTVLPTIKFAEL